MCLGGLATFLHAISQHLGDKPAYLLYTAIPKAFIVNFASCGLAHFLYILVVYMGFATLAKKALSSSGQLDIDDQTGRQTGRDTNTHNKQNISTRRRIVHVAGTHPLQAAPGYIVI